MMKYKLKVINIKHESKNTITYYLEKPEDLTWAEGAHTHIGIVGFDIGEKPNKSLVRHMSITTLPSENALGITTRLLEPYSEFKAELSKIKNGDELIIFKIGSRMELRREHRPLVLLSMGVGSATMRPLALAFQKDPSNIPEMININVDATKDYLFKEELDALQGSNYRNIWANGRTSFYESLEQVSSLERPIYYVVGSDPFIKDIIRVLRKTNVLDQDIILDKKADVLDYYFT